MLHNQEKLEVSHWVVSKKELEHELALKAMVESNIRYHKKLSELVSWWSPKTKSEARIVEEYPVKREERYRNKYKVKILEEEVKSLRRQYYHEKNWSETNTMIDVEASHLWKSYT